MDPVGRHFVSTLYRTCRLGGFVATLWLLTPWWGRRDLLLVKCHLTALFIVLGSVLLGLILAPGRALAQGRLSGELWPITPVQVSDFAAVALGLLVVLWFCGELRHRPLVTLFAILATTAMLLMTHTRTELIALVAGVLLAGLRMFAAEARVRRLFTSIGVLVLLAAVMFSGALTTWLARGENSQELTDLTGRTAVWTDVLNAPRDRFQVIVGYGLSNKGYNGLPIDSNWFAAYWDLGLVGVGLCIAMLLFVLVSSYFQPRSTRTALALFLVTYLTVTSFTETGLSDASVYLLELALAASLLVPSRWREETGSLMKIMLVHNRCRSNGPSGENRVVDQEGEALAAAGNQVIRFGRSSDEIEHWPVAKKALLPARVVWSAETRRDLATALQIAQARRRPCAQHLSPAQRRGPLRVP